MADVTSPTITTVSGDDTTDHDTTTSTCMLIRDLTDVCGHKLDVAFETPDASDLEPPSTCSWARYVRLVWGHIHSVCLQGFVSCSVKFVQSEKCTPWYDDIFLYIPKQPGESSIKTLCLLEQWIVQFGLNACVTTRTPGAPVVVEDQHELRIRWGNEELEQQLFGLVCGSFPKSTSECTNNARDYHGTQAECAKTITHCSFPFALYAFAVFQSVSRLEQILRNCSSTDLKDYGSKMWTRSVLFLAFQAAQMEDFIPRMSEFTKAQASSAQNTPNFFKIEWCNLYSMMAAKTVRALIEEKNVVVHVDDLNA